MPDKLPLAISDGVVEQLQSGDVLINQEGTVVYAAAAFATDNVVLRSDGTGFGSKLSGLSISDSEQLIWPTTNIFMGAANTGASITTGVNNLAIGAFAGNAITGGDRNIFVGVGAGFLSITGDGNVGVGHSSLAGVTNSNNVAIGGGAGGRITSGIANTFLGKDAGDPVGQLATANRSMALGTNAFTTKDDQIVLGQASAVETILRGVVEGDDGTFVYNPSAFVTDNTIVRADTVTGTDAVQTSDLTLSDSGQLFWNQTPPNVIIGYNQTGQSFDESGAPGVEGRDNMLMGGFCGVNITIGTRNMLIGGSTGSSLIEGKQNCCVGFGSFANNVTTTLLGDVTLPGEADDNVGIGNRTGLSIDTGKQNVFIGSEAGFNASQLVTADNSIAIGYLTFTTADNQMILGNTSITDTKIRGVVELKQTTALETSGAHLPIFTVLDSAGAISFQVTSFTSATGNIGIGVAAGVDITTATNCVCLGTLAGTNITTGGNNSCFGFLAGATLTTGSGNTYVGAFAGVNASTGSSNFGSGVGSLGGLTIGQGNTGIGAQAGSDLTTGGNNVFIGKDSGDNVSQKIDADNSIAIGFGTFTTADNQVVIGNASITETILRGVVEGDSGTFVYAPSDLAVDNSIVRADGTGVGVQTSGLSISDIDQLIFASTNVLIGNATTAPVITTGVGNFILGAAAGFVLEDGNSNVFIGSGAGFGQVSGDNSVGIGSSSLLSATGNDNVGIGVRSGFTITSGISNTFIGANAGEVGQLATADRSTAIGESAVTTKDDQVVIGSAAVVETILRGQVFTGDGAYETLKRTAKTSSASLTTETLVLVDATSGEVTITLPPAADLVDTPVHVKKIDASAFAVIIEGDGSETIDDQLNATFSDQYTCLTLVSDGTEWWIL